MALTVFLSFLLLVMVIATCPHFSSAKHCTISQFPCANGTVCVDIYEQCDGTNACSDDSDESATTCPEGSGPIPEDYLVVGDADFGTLFQVQISTGMVHRLTVTSSSEPKGIAIDPQTGDLYYADSSSQSIKRLEWSTNTVTVIYDNIATSSKLSGVALDMERRMIYYADNDAKNIIEIKIDDNTYQRTVQTGVEAKTLVFDKANKMLYWSDVGSSSGIYKCSATEDSVAAVPVITNNIEYPAGFAIDWSESKIYWTESMLHSIHTANLDGSNPMLIREEAFWRGSFTGITVTPNHVFFLEGSYNSIRAFDKHTSDFHQYAEQRFKNPAFIANNITDEATCMRDYEHCSTGAGCVYKYYICDGENDCADGSDEATLCPGGKKEYLTDNYLLVADDMHSSFFQVDPSNGDIVYVSGLDTNMPWTTAVNPQTGDIYYADDAEQIIARFSMSSKEITTILNETDPIGFGSITLDAEANVLYFSNNEAPAYLAAIDLSDNSVRKIYENPDMYPRTGLFLDKEERVLYWSDNLLHGIYKISVDTEGAESVEVIPGIDDPDGFTVDFKTGEMFWADSTTNMIEKAKLDGSNRQVMLNDVKGHIYRSMTSDSQYIYYTDATTSYIRKIDRTSFAEADYTDQRFASLTAIRFVQSIMTTTEGPSTTSGGSAGSTTQASGPSGQSTQGGGPTGPSTQGGGQTGPSTQSGGPSGPSTQGGGPSGPSTQSGGPSGPSTQGGGPSGPSTQGGGPSGESTTVGSSQSTGSSGGNKSKIIAIVVPIAVAVGAIIAILIALACVSFGGPSGMASTGATAAAGGYNPYGQEGFRPGGMRRNPGNYNDGYRIA